MRLTIRAEQRAVIEAISQENFVRRIAAHLLADYSDSMVTLPGGDKFQVAELTAETLNELVRTGIERARSYEMTFESSISTFTVLMFAVSPNFDRHTLFQVILADEAVEPNHRLDDIGNIFTEKNWDSIREKYDPKAWDLEEAPPTVNETDEQDASPEAASEPENEEFDDQDFEDTIKITDR